MIDKVAVISSFFMANVRDMLEDIGGGKRS